MIKVNGKPLNGDGITLLKLFEREAYNPKRIAAELNGKIIKKADYDDTVLHDGDVLEVVHFVGGG